MDLEYIFGAMEIDTKEILRIVLNMDLAMRKMPKVTSTKVIFREDKNMAMGSIIGQMVATTVESSKMAKRKGKECGNQALKANITKAHIKREKDKDWEFMFGRMVLFTKESIVKI